MNDLKFSKKKQLQNNVIDKKEFKALTCKESDLQNLCEEYLDWMHVRYIRIPDILYNIIFNPLSDVYKLLPDWIRKIIAKYIKGLPDLTILFPDGRYWCVELKIKKGRMSQGQKTFAKYVPITIKRSFEDFKKELDEKIENK